MSAIKALQTRYAGCHFRSRLEARWAVAFDHLGIRWEFEPEGLLVSDRLTAPGSEDDLRAYLPDFWLPDYGVWAEVKGSLTRQEASKFFDAAAHISSNGGGGCHDNGGNDVLLLGPIPRPEGILRVPFLLHMHKGDLQATAWFPDGSTAHPGHIGDRLVGSDSGEIFVNGDDLLLGFPFCHLPDGELPRVNQVAAAYTAARSARFEHGQSGAR